jgi:hypothetical protein
MTSVQGEDWILAVMMVDILLQFLAAGRHEIEIGNI